MLNRGKNSRRARFRKQGVANGVTDATNLTIILRWCAQNNGAFLLEKAGGRGKGRIGPSRWRVVLLKGPDLETLGRRGERVMYDDAHPDISKAVAKAARCLEDMITAGV